MEVLNVSGELKWEEFEDQNYQFEVNVIEEMTDLLGYQEKKSELLKILDENLKRIQNTEGHQSYFYLVALNNKLSILYDS